jgi:AraC-like DNA-binding protein
MKNGPSTDRQAPVPPKTKTRKSIAQPVQDKPYHHGSLPHALLEAAETVLRRDGIGSLTLRAIAREAGVSHTAPQHHFGQSGGHPIRAGQPKGHCTRLCQLRGR